MWKMTRSIQIWLDLPFRFMPVFSIRSSPPFPVCRTLQYCGQTLDTTTRRPLDYDQDLHAVMHEMRCVFKAV